MSDQTGKNATTEAMCPWCFRSPTDHDYNVTHWTGITPPKPGLDAIDTAIARNERAQPWSDVAVLVAAVRGLREQRDQQDAVIAKITAIHQRYRRDPSFCDICDAGWPCSTAKALGVGVPIGDTEETK